MTDELNKYTAEQNKKHKEWLKLGLERKDLDHRQATMLVIKLKEFFEKNHNLLGQSYPEFIRRNGFWMNDFYGGSDWSICPRPIVWTENGYAKLK